MGVVANPKFTMEFTYGQIGWTESHYYLTTPPLTDSTLNAAGIALANARVQCLDGVNGKLTGMKLSVDNVNRDVYKYGNAAVPQPGASGYAGGPVVDGIVWTWQSPQVSWPINIETQNATSESITYIAGMPAATDQTGPGPLDVGTAPSPYTYLGIYGRALINGPWGALSRTWPTPTITPGNSTAMGAVPTYLPATATNPATFALSLTPVMAGGTAVPGSYIRLGGLKWTGGVKRQRFNGTYQVTAIVGGLITVAAPRAYVPVNFTSSGYAQLSTVTVQDYLSFTVDNITHRKRGRPFDLPRGRVTRP